ncbi:hypothetical protein D8B26_000831 [Coccidioides posadasii str. Silveira]|uniref:Cell polarity protein n=3 Tax=Coccidioides posadasii TaxID=199306 RepID=E9CRX3_COCPS|nr:CAP-Gly domain containing protein [Coccidioides posadasii C735 delta SOWgp]EER29083.1 CAP-Gly domain containing protein [Coccidioides posadasii C735 delta SOWgp]EFW22496.1 cell polarity protein [Coccidioides posadasii str. Silveira]KMM63951.1 tubulin-folding cofactor B [Coccidioides posadasii RMSCC 3488]QVM06118.1 hypothetical protein D8B26_000831 [Coccidioides posadasii str. Silveira]|eukprot:XP_003071228.1 CAP-Gly domain containing protein [Coccidioides posadasii C735 delta SOWgp]
MAFQATPADVSVIVTVAADACSGDNCASFATERRITPTWTVSLLKAKLETMCGIPPGCQRLRLKAPGLEARWIDNNSQLVGDWGLAKGCEIEIHDLRPPAARPNYTDVSSVEKYTLPTSTYESLPNTVLSWKKAQKLGRFDPKALTPEEVARNQANKDESDIRERGIELSRRAIVLPSSPPHIRRGTIRFVGPVPTIPSGGAQVSLNPGDPAPLWVGIEFDEPLGKNNGSVGGKSYFTCPEKCGVFVKPEKVEVGDFPPLGLDLDEDMEEI